MTEIVTTEVIEKAAKALAIVQAKQFGFSQGVKWEALSPGIQFEAKEQVHAAVQVAAPFIAEAVLKEFYDRVLRKTEYQMTTVGSEVADEILRTAYEYHQEQQP